MYGLKVRIRRVTENDRYPERVECFMTDYEGQTHFFEDKVTAFTSESDPMIPGDGVIRCTVLREMPLFVEKLILHCRTAWNPQWEERYSAYRATI